MREAFSTIQRYLTVDGGATPAYNPSVPQRTYVAVENRHLSAIILECLTASAVDIYVRLSVQGERIFPAAADNSGDYFRVTADMGKGVQIPIGADLPAREITIEYYTDNATDRLLHVVLITGGKDYAEVQNKAYERLIDVLNKIEGKYLQ